MNILFCLFLFCLCVVFFVGVVVYSEKNKKGNLLLKEKGRLINEIKNYI